MAGFSQSITEQAAEWLLAFEEGPLSEAERCAFVAWLKRSPVHVEEFLQLSILHREISQSPDLDTVVDQALAELQGTVVPLANQAVRSPSPPSLPEPAERPRSAYRSRWFGLAAGVLVLITGALVSYTLIDGSDDQTYSTGIGVQHSVALADGSVITLNTQSEVRVHFERDQRRATLLRGEAMFEIARDPKRPFHVSAGPMAVRVLGTRFNIYRQPARTELTVLEGEVDVAAATASPTAPSPDATEPAPITADSPQPPPRSTLLNAGQQLAVTADGHITDPHKVDLVRVTAWTERRVIFEAAPLADVIAEFNRYNHRNLVLDDPWLAAREVTGVFRVHDISVLITFLRRQHGVRMRNEGKNIRIFVDDTHLPSSSASD